MTVAELAERLSGRIIISSEITDADVSDADPESLIAHILAYFEGKQGINVLGKKALAEVLEQQRTEKAPVEVEVIRSTQFKPIAKEVHEKFEIKSSRIEKTSGTASAFVEYFNDRFENVRKILESNRRLSGMLNSIEATKQYTTGREVSIIGIVFDKRITKNGHILITLEDQTSNAKVLFTKPSQQFGAELFENAKHIANDDIIAVRGKISGPFVIANEIIWPDVPVRSRTPTEEDVAIAFLSDIHVGSKLFLEKSFNMFIRWLSGGVDYKKELAGKIKYILLSGDLADGIGVYPNQDRDLSVPDIYKQYSLLFDFVEEIPDYIQVFAMPGNHDAVQLQEPQPPLPSELISDFKRGNVHMISNPSSISIHGVRVLAYHGASLDSMIQNVPGCSYAKPETAMIEILRRRHLSPIYGGNAIVPSKSDELVIKEVPDILHMGHIHKNALTEYHGTIIVNSGTWQARTAYQIKQGHMPSPAILPIYETKSMTMSQIDFNTL